MDRLPTWMVPLMEFLHSMLGNVRVNLSCRQVGMAQQQLYDPQIRAVIQQMGCESMPEGVRRQFFLDARGLRMSLNSIPESLPCHRNASIAGKDAVLGKISLKQFKPGFRQKASNPGDRFFPHRHQPLLRALSNDSNNALTKVDFAQLKASELADSKSAGVQNLKHGAITHPH